jgi:hypothetical protein
MKKKKLIFKKGVKVMHIPLGVLPIPTSNGDITINPFLDMANFEAKYTYTKKAKLTYHIELSRGGETHQKGNLYGFPVFVGGAVRELRLTK